jgi:hypothetical protein
VTVHLRLDRTARHLGVVAAAVVLAVGCSSDDGAATRRTGGGVEIIGPQPEGGGGSVSAVGPGCTTKGATTKRAARTIEVRLDEGSLTVPATTPVGVTRVLVKNFGSVPHGLVLTRAADPAALPRRDGVVDLDALATDATFRLEAFAPNTICEGTYELPPGTYVAFCPEAGTGGARSHLDQGMVATFTVT